jgi:hypothetical protein
MAIHEILLEDWSEYDNKKIRGGSDRNNFACTESWEVDYLIKKIYKHYPNYTHDQIREAITQCCTQVGSPHPRDTFVACVLKRLGAIS